MAHNKLWVAQRVPRQILLDEQHALHRHTLFYEVLVTGRQNIKERHCKTERWAHTVPYEDSIVLKSDYAKVPCVSSLSQRRRTRQWKTMFVRSTTDSSVCHIVEEACSVDATSHA